MDEKNMCVWGRVLASQIRKKKAKGEGTEDIETKINVFYAAGKLTGEEYEYLVSLL